MKIEKIEKTKSGKYKLLFDSKDKIITYSDVILNHNLLYDKNLTYEDLNDINIDTKYYDIYDKLIKLVLKKLRSEKEIINYLDKYEVDKNEQQIMIDNLKKAGLINDLLFAKAYTSDRFNLSNDGPNKIRRDLIEYGIDECYITEAINQIKEEDIITKITKIINKKIALNHKYSKKTV